MSHQSGIPICESLRVAFAEARDDDNVRAIKVSIVDEKMVPVAKISKKGTWDADFALLQEHCVERTPCYLLFKQDESKEDGNNHWLFVVFAPDNSPIKARMLYASSRDTCKKSLGQPYFSDDFHVTEISELTYANFNSHKQGKYVEAPLTQAEIEIKAERTAEVDYGTSQVGVHSVKFPISPQGIAQLESLKNGSITAVLLCVDPEKETIELMGSKSVNVAELSDSLPADQPCFIFFRYVHQHEGNPQEPIVFVYSCPMKSKIKLKMLHSTVKQPALDGAASVGITAACKVEVMDAEDLDAELLNSTLHPAKREVVAKKAFARPVAAGRGPRRRPTRNRK